jgi:hypothetical protein
MVIKVDSSSGSLVWGMGTRRDVGRSDALRARKSCHVAIDYL